ncbi:Protein FAM110B [Anthophora quadrimaculata]
MMTAMARLPCKQTSSSQQPRVNNFGNSYWNMQTRHPAPPYVRNHQRHTDHTGKRKSAVELLQETKAFYVKSETVLDRKQELKNSGHLQVSQLSAPSAPPRLLRKCGNTSSCSMQPTSPSQLPPASMTPPCCWASCHEQDRPDGVLSPQQTLPPALPPKSPRLVPVPQRRTISGPPSSIGGDQLQAKLRRLLNTDSKENVFFPDSPTQTVVQSNGLPQEEKFRYSPGSLSPNFREEDRGKHYPQHDIRFKFGRSNSHSHTSGRAGRKSTSSPSVENTVCHKSLPDLHTSTRRRASLSPRASTNSSKPSGHHQSSSNCPDCETSSDYSEHSFKRDAVCYRSYYHPSSRHIRRSLGSGGCDASSVLSAGGRTQKSSGSSKLSHGATARDSGGSSGHCTPRSEPPPVIQDCWSHIRRDSGASTQHSTEKDRSRRGSYANGTPPSVVRRYSPESESSNSQTDYSPTCNSRFSDGWKEGRGRPILRSKSDISDRYWRQDNGRPNKVPARPPRSVTQLENFFDCLGLDSDNYQRITKPDSKSSSPVFFDSVSSVDSALGIYSWAGNNQTNQGSQWQNNDCSVGMGNDDSNQRVSDPPSIVERNARIIKWLCQCRKVQFGFS